MFLAGIVGVVYARRFDDPLVFLPEHCCCNARINQQEGQLQNSLKLALPWMVVIVGRGFLPPTIVIDFPL
jgi:hypothetical protein